MPTLKLNAQGIFEEVELTANNPQLNSKSKYPEFITQNEEAMSQIRRMKLMFEQQEQNLFAMVVYYKTTDGDINTFMVDITSKQSSKLLISRHSEAGNFNQFKWDNNIYAEMVREDDLVEIFDAYNATEA